MLSEYMMLINQLENYEQPNNLAVHKWTNLNPLTESSLMSFVPLPRVRPKMKKSESSNRIFFNELFSPAHS